MEETLSKENVIDDTVGWLFLDENTTPLLSMLSLLYKPSKVLSCVSLTEITTLIPFCSKDQIQISGDF